MRVHIVASAFASVLLPALAQVTTGPSASVSITAYPAYATGLDCLTRCIWGSLRPGIIYSTDLAAVIGCGSQWSYNGCFCRADHANEADSFLESCISSRCSTLTEVAGAIDVQVTSAQSIYDGYCGQVRADEAGPTTTTSFSESNASSNPPSTAASSAAVTGASETAAQSTRGGSSVGNESSNTSSNSLSKSDVIALGVGLGLGVPSLLIGVATLWVQVRKRKSTKEGQQEMRETSRY